MIKECIKYSFVSFLIIVLIIIIAGLIIKSRKYFPTKNFMVWASLHYRYQNLTKKAKLANKLLAKDIAKKNGAVVAKLYFSNDDPKVNIPFDKLPKMFIVKAIHGCQWNFVYEEKKINKSEIQKWANKLLKKTYSNSLPLQFVGLSEPHYKLIKPSYLVEEYIECMKTSPQYNFHVINSHMVFCSMYDQQKNTMSLYDKDFKQLKVQNNLFYKKMYETMMNKGHTFVHQQKPKCWKKMIDFSEKIVDSFKYARVDLFCCENTMYFSEVTFSPYNFYHGRKPKII